MTVTKEAFARDLQAVRDQSLSFEVLTRRHAGLMCNMVNRWMRRVPCQFSAEDMVQEGWLMVFAKLKDFDSRRGVPLDRYVLKFVRLRVQSLTTRARNGVQFEQLYLDMQIVEHRVVQVFEHLEGSDSGEHVCMPMAVTHADQDHAVKLSEGRARIARVLGEISSRQATAVAGVIAGRSREQIIDKVFSGKCKRPEKQYLRAIAGATNRVELLTAQEEMNFDAPHNDNAQLKLRPISKIRGTAHAGQGEQGFAAPKQEDQGQPRCDAGSGRSAWRRGSEDARRQGHA